ncbi:MAG TPA: exodeoxyribonuclease VII small subunit [Candidatus Saccharimonadales bacterium]|nr:exodeoxyribonuclease VII small subunit [Candidatus Saccharimonadales bacterium]
MADSKENYQSLKVELDKVLAKLQDGDLLVDEATKIYEKGMLLIQELEKHLKTAENKVTKIKADFDSKKE